MSDLFGLAVALGALSQHAKVRWQRGSPRGLGVEVVQAVLEERPVLAPAQEALPVGQEQKAPWQKDSSRPVVQQVAPQEPAVEPQAVVPLPLVQMVLRGERPVGQTAGLEQLPECPQPVAPDLKRGPLHGEA
ncbi:MAG TPA: hypothetical protein PL064_06185, partial [Thermogutta sp.]|nr:hypothetical protein [Thermogutta sp.]